MSPGLYRDTDDTGARYTGLIAGVRIDHALNDAWSGFVEASAPHVRGGHDSHAVATFDVGAARAVSDNVSVAVAYSAGLTDASADHGVTLALSRHW